MGTRIGYAAGAFDLFHVGHLNILRHAREHCAVLIAGVVSDEMLRTVKGIEPVVPTAERAEIVRHISYVDDVYIETRPMKMDAWHDLHFTHFFKGDDWRGTEKRIALEHEFAVNRRESRGPPLCRLDRVARFNERGCRWGAVSAP